MMNRGGLAGLTRSLASSGLSDLTVGAYVGQLNRLGGITAESVHERMSLLSMPSRAQLTAALHAYNRWMQQEMGEPPVEFIAYSYFSRKMPKPLEPAEVEVLDEALSENKGQTLALAIALMRYAGLRVSEMLSVGRQNVSGTERRPNLRVVGKGRKERLVPIIPVLQEHINAYDGRDNTPWIKNSRGVVYRWCRKLGSLLGIPKLHPHRLRHTCATELIRSRFPPIHVQKWLGHSTFSTTELYLRLVTDDLWDVIDGQ